MTSLPSIPIIDLPEEESSRSYGILTVSKAAQRVVLPLTKVDLCAKVAGQVAEVKILQTFRNPYQEALEAILESISNKLKSEQSARAEYHPVTWREVMIEPGLKIMIEDQWRLSDEESLAKRIQSALSTLVKEKNK